VSQGPCIFNYTLWNNITIGNRQATSKKVERICKIAWVDDFLDELLNEY
jgi:subfamily B ATP-binding cassette protein MsbA